VTAIVGFNCQDGVVIAADTEESYGYDKAYTNKIFPVEREESRLCVAGAGSGYLIDYANEQIVSAFDSGPTNANEFQTALSEIMDELYEKKFKYFPVSSRDELRIALLVGVQFASENSDGTWMQPALFECQANLVTPIKRTKQSCILGSAEIMKEIGIQLAGWGLDTKLAEWASMYLIHQAKRRVGGVGGKTHVFTMRTDGGFKQNRGYNVIEKEAILDGFGRTCQLLLLSLDPSVTNSRSKDFVDAAKRWFSSARKYLDKVERETGKGKHESIEIRSREIEAMLRRTRATTRSIFRKSESEQ
jgi:hypothetical protein